MRYEDPSIQKAATVLASEVWDDTERMVRAGIDFYRAREIALGKQAGGWSKRYGKDCAERAVRMVHAMDPTNPACFSAETLATKAKPRADNGQIWFAAIAALVTFLVAPPSLIVWVIVWFSGSAGKAGSLFLLSGILAAKVYCDISKPEFHA